MPEIVTYPQTCPFINDDCLADRCMMWRHNTGTTYGGPSAEAPEGFFYCGAGGFPKNDVGRIPDD